MEKSERATIGSERNEALTVTCMWRLKLPLMREQKLIIKLNSERIMETKLIIASLKQAISELQHEKYQQEKNGLAKAALNFVEILETQVNGLERSSDKCHIQNVSGSLLPTKKSEMWLRKYTLSKLEKESYNKKEITKMLAYVFEQAWRLAKSNDR